MESVHFAEHVKVSFSHVQNTPQSCRQLTKLKIITASKLNNSIITKVVVKFGSSEMMYVELRAKQL